MSTRGCVAVGTPKNWRGIYNHSDSYPTYLGAELFEHLIREQLAGKTFAEIGESILRFDDWRNYLAGGVCQYCGKITGQPHSISGGIYGKEVENGKYPDPQAKHHHHNDLNEDNLITSDNPDPLFIEWVYVIDPNLQVIHVLAHDGRSLKPSEKVSQNVTRIVNGRSRTYYDSGCVYWHDKVAELRLMDKPDFADVECDIQSGKYSRCNHYAWYHKLVPKTCNLSTQTWLGKRPLEMRDAIAVEIGGKILKLTGSGGDADFLNKANFRTGRMNANTPLFPSGTWVATCVYNNGRRVELPIAKRVDRDYQPLPGVTWIFPALKDQPASRRTK